MLSPTRPSTPRRPPPRPQPLLHPSQEPPLAGEAASELRAALGRAKEAGVCSCRQSQQFLPTRFMVTVPSWAMSDAGSRALTSSNLQHQDGDSEAARRRGEGSKAGSLFSVIFPPALFRYQKLLLPLALQRPRCWEDMWRKNTTRGCWGLHPVAHGHHAALTLAATGSTLGLSLPRATLAAVLVWQLSLLSSSCF